MNSKIIQNHLPPSSKFVIIKLFTLCVFFLCTLAISAQTSYDSQKAALIIRLSDHISWPNGKIKGNFNIGIMGEDSITYKTLKDGEASLKRQNRPIKIIPIKSLSEIDNLHVLFVSKSLNHRIEKISSKIENKQILLITDHCPDPKYIMLNITYNPKLKQSAFEVNKANLMLENLSINPKLLLLGGTEVDLRDLYRTARAELEEEQQRSATQKIEIEVQEKKLVRQLFQINNLIDSTKALQESIVNKELLMLKVSNDLEQQKQEFIQHDIKYKTQQHNIYLKNREISRKIKTLDSLKLIADRNNRVIETQSAQLAINKKHIIYQKKLLTQSITIAMVFVLLGLLLLVVYIRMRLLNKRLRISYDTIEDANIQLELNQKDITELNTNLLETNDSLHQSNENLRIKTDKLEHTIDELKLTQQKLIQSEKMAALGILTSGVAHEVLNPLNFVKSGIDLLKDSISDLTQAHLLEHEKEAKLESIKELTNHMETGVERIDNIVRSLNAFSRSKENEKVSFSLHDTVNDCVTILEHELKKKSIQLSQNLLASPEMIIGNPGKIHQVLINILINSVQAISTDGLIKINSETKNNLLYLIIEDNGCGINNKDLEQIFDPFYTTKDPGEGTGLGLSIVYSILQEHQAEIYVTSELNKGTKVTIKFISTNDKINPIR